MSVTISAFTHSSRIRTLTTELGDYSCGTVSICSIYEYFKLEYHPQTLLELSRDGRKTQKYPMDGSTIIGLALGASFNSEIKVDVYSKYGASIEEFEPYLIYEYDKEIVAEIKKQRNINFHNPISLDQILDKIAPSSIPILQFCRDGVETNRHNSPLIGINIGKYLLFPVDDADGKIEVEKAVFGNIWWPETSCVYLTHQKVETETREKNTQNT